MSWFLKVKLDRMAKRWEKLSGDERAWWGRTAFQCEQSPPGALAWAYCKNGDVVRGQWLQMHPPGRLRRLLTWST